MQSPKSELMNLEYLNLFEETSITFSYRYSILFDVRLTNKYEYEPLQGRSLPFALLHVTFGYIPFRSLVTET